MRNKLVALALLPEKTGIPRGSYYLMEQILFQILFQTILNLRKRSRLSMSATSRTTLLHSDPCMTKHAPCLSQYHFG